MRGKPPAGLFLKYRRVRPFGNIPTRPHPLSWASECPSFVIRQLARPGIVGDFHSRSQSSGATRKPLGSGEDPAPILDPNFCPEQTRLTAGGQTSWTGQLEPAPNSTTRRSRSIPALRPRTELGMKYGIGQIRFPSSRRRKRVLLIHHHF